MTPNSGTAEVTDDGAATQKNMDRLEEQAGVDLTKFNKNKFKFNFLLLERKNLLQWHRLEAAVV